MSSMQLLIALMQLHLCKISLPMNQLSDYINAKLHARGMKKADLARAASLSPSQVTRIMNQSSKPSQEALIAIARALGVPREEIFRMAGVLPPVPVTKEYQDKLLYKVSLMTEHQKEIFLSMADYVLKEGGK